MGHEPHAIKEWTFSAGEAVPQWLESYDAANLRVVFGRDALVIKTEAGAYHVYPRSVESMLTGDCLISIARQAHAPDRQYAVNGGGAGVCTHSLPRSCNSPDDA